MKFPPLYALYCLAVLSAFGFTKYEGLGLFSTRGSAQGAVSTGVYHRYPMGYGPGGNIYAFHSAGTSGFFHK